MVLGLITGAVCALAIDLKWRLGFDDALDVVGIHLVGGLIGTLYIGIFGNGIGLIYTGSLAQLGAQAIGAFSVLFFSFFTSALLGWILQKTMGFRIKNEDEVAGVDLAMHGEESYLLDEREREALGV
jgi:Amt family ammonium transporter